MSKEFLCHNCDCITSCSDAEIGFCCNNRCNSMTAQRLQRTLSELSTITKQLDEVTKVKERYREALEFIKNGCLVPPDGGSPDINDYIKTARQALSPQKKEGVL